MHKRLIFVVSFLLLVSLVPLHAQANPDYAIVNVADSVSSDQSQLILVVTIENLGAAATVPTQLITRLNGESELELSIQTVEPLGAGEIVEETINLSVDDFPTNGAQSILISVGLDGIEASTATTLENNVWTVDITIGVADDITLLDVKGSEYTVLGYVFSREDAALYLVMFAAIVIMLWLLSVVLRLLFRRPARFGTWQPPYGLMPMYDQNTMEGRRQAWQTHAQNSLLLAAPNDGNLHPVKMLIGTDGGNLHNWKITALRLSQYDTYGRIARSQAVADKKWVKRLNNVLKKRTMQTEEKVQKMLRPVAGGLVREFRKKVNKKNGFLPISLDVRFEGKHGEVRIVFELYQCQGRAWYRLDQWEPTMMVVAQTMQENFTFTIHGRLNNEKMNEFSDRLRDDIIWLLLEMVRVEEWSHQPQPAAEKPREAFNIPDTLSGMQPIHDDSQPYPSGA
jgi:hypothetical protein